jgi:hypothetical protein
MSAESKPLSLRIEQLNPTYDAYGMVLDLLSRHAPFAEFRLNQIGTAIREQLKKGQHVAALTPDNELAGYTGWVFTLAASAELWMRDRGTLKVVSKNHDAFAVTIVVSTDPKATAAMIRRCKALNPGLRGYFKRSYDGELRPSRKQSLRTGPADAAG